SDRPGSVSLTRTALGMVAERRFPPEATAAAEARRALDDLLGPHLDDAALENARLLASELVANAVLHGPKGPHADILLRVSVREAVVRVEVIDDGPGFVRPRRPPEGTGGWGLVLVESVADRWGIERGGPTTVWFELARSDVGRDGRPVRSRWSPQMDPILLEVEMAGVIAADRDGTVTRWNRHAARLFGFDAADAVGRPIVDLLVPDEDPDAGEHLLRLLHDEETFDGEWLAPRKGGGRVWVRLSATPVRDEKRRHVGMVLVALDISARRRAQAALAESEERLRIALDAGRMGTWDWDMRRGTMRWSESLERIHGLEPGAFGGMFEHFQADIHPEDRAAVLESMQAAVREDREWSLDYRIVRPDGAVRWLAIRGRVLKEDERAVGMAGVCADITARKETERSLAVQYSVARVLSTATSAEESTPALIQAIAETLGLEVGALWHVDEDADVLRFVGGWNSSSVGAHFLLKSREFLFERGYGLPGRVWASGEPTWLTDLAADDNFSRAPFALRDGLRSALGFPITLRDEVLGVMEFFSRRIRQPDEQLLALLSAVGAHIGQFLERRSAETELVESEARKSAILESALEAIVSMDEEGNIVEMNTAAAEMFGVDRDDAIGRELAGIMIPPTYRERHREALDRFRRTGRDRILGRRLELHGMRADGTEFPVELTVTRVELPNPEEILFTGYIRDLTPRRRAEELQARLFESERAAREQIERAHDREAFLSEAGVLLASSLDLRRTLAKIARLVVPRLADWCSIDLVEPDGSIAVVAATHADPDKTALAREFRHRHPLRLDDGSGVASVISSGVAEIVPEMTPDALAQEIPEPGRRAIAAELGFRSSMVVPLVARGRALGAITFATAEWGRTFGEDDLDLAQELARRAALAIDNSRLYEERSHIARTLQRTLLPRRLPEIPGLQVAAFYQSAGRMQTEVGGDFYDVFESGDRAWGVVVGDVCGKGVEAAALTGMARHSVRGSALREPSPSAALEDVNRIMLREDGERFCTVALGRIERADAGVVLTVACGGHPQPIVVRRDGRVEPVGVPGTLLGVFEHVTIEDAVAGLAHGDQAVFFTDGLVDARHPKALDETSLLELAASCAGVGAHATAERFARAMADPVGEAPDDVCVVAVSVD
ncbi:MAG TPA: PAS domain S-box protein, partial [Actinomycetota bacterium]|nr:PAS domain S-box protein [Actinomycetota bacterium]